MARGRARHGGLTTLATSYQTRVLAFLPAFDDDIVRSQWRLATLEPSQARLATVLEDVDDLVHSRIAAGDPFNH